MNHNRNIQYKYKEAMENMTSRIPLKVQDESKFNAKKDYTYVVITKRHSP